MLDVVVDGIIYEMQARGGISRLFSEILPRICDIDESCHINLLTSGRPRQPLPTHSRIIRRSLPPVEHLLRPRRVFWRWAPRARELMQQLLLRGATGRIWHSTYYTMVTNWSGPVAVTVADMIYERFSNLFIDEHEERFREQKRRCVLAADAVICISEATRQDVERYYGIDSRRTRVVPLACSSAFHASDGTADSSMIPVPTPFFLYVGERVHYKNFRRLLETYRAWPSRRQVHLVVVGRPWSASERRHLSELGVDNLVHLLAEPDDEELCLLYNQALALLYPSMYEGFGIPLLEAMACGCPIVASRIPSTLEVAEQIPIYFEPTDLQGLQAALDIVLSEGRGSTRVRRGLDRAKEYSWDKAARQTLDLYRELSG
ncbi:MAG TPA: glycosyltransferase family 1 protein [Thermoleophilia bacterium]|nr:glycosyltransferase family 1 protein [Thermoleophilia bacterium]